MTINNEFFDSLLKLEAQGIYLSGDVAKRINANGEEQLHYLERCLAAHKKTSKERLIVYQQVLSQNKDLREKDKESHDLIEKLKKEKEKTAAILELTEKSKITVEQELDIIKTKSKSQLFSKALAYSGLLIGFIIFSVTLIYGIHIYKELDSTEIASFTFNIFHVSLTSFFTIVGSVIGVRMGANSKDVT